MALDVADGAETLARRLAMAPAAAATAMAMGGLWRARREPKGRGGGTPYRKIPVVVCVALGSVYAVLSVKTWRTLPLGLAPAARFLSALLGLLLYTTGMGFIFGGRLALGNMYNISATTGAELYANHRLVTSGAFRLMRHPMYFGAGLAGLGALLIYRTWTMVLICLHLPIFFIRARREEEVLEQEFGDEWRAYKAWVPAGIPGLPRTSP